MTKLSQNKSNTVTGKKRALPRNTDRAVQELIRTVNNLEKCLRQENEALEKSDVPSFLALQDRKIEVTHKYNDAMQQLLSRKGELKALPPEQKQALLEARETFAALTRDNLAHIERMRGSIERLNGHIMHSARRHAGKRGVNYSPRGHIQKETRSLSMGLNESA